MKTPTSILILVFSCVISAGTLTAQEVVAPAGDHFINSSAQMSYTLGEPVIATVSDDSNTMTQGFQQSNLTVTGIETLIDKVSVSIYPNPTSDRVMVDLGNVKGDFDLILFSGSGQLVYSERLGQDRTLQIDMSHYANGNYLLNVVDRTNPLKRNTYQIIKTHN